MLRTLATTVTASSLASSLFLGCTAAGIERGDFVETIVYTTLRPPNQDIYFFERAGAEPRRLTTHPALDYNASFSPDGRWLVFTSERNGNADLFLLDLHEEDPTLRQLTSNPSLDDAATFSPDGARLAFVSTRDGNADIFVMPFAPEDPDAERQAVNLTNSPGGDFQPAYSPDGARIAFTRQGRLYSTETPDNSLFDISTVDLWVMAADGSEPRCISERMPGYEVEAGVRFGCVAGSPSWSQDGGFVYYYRVAADGASIRRMRPDGSEDSLIVVDGFSPVLAPGGRILFSRRSPEEGMDFADSLRTGRLSSVAADGTDLIDVSGPERHYFAPHVDLATGRIVAHGLGATAGQVGEIDDGLLIAPPGARNRIRIDGREVVVWGMRGFFPALTTDGEVVSTILEPTPEGIPLRRCALDGSKCSVVFSSPAGFTFGAAVAREAGWIVVGGGPPFGSSEESVDIWKLRQDGSEAVNLTAESPGNDAVPHVSQDARHIVFRGGGDGAGYVFVMDSDGKERRRLTEGDDTEAMPALSNDGEWVVFTTTRAAGRKLWIQRLDGSEGRFLEPDRLEVPDTSIHARFSPDDRWIVFTSDRGGYNDEWPLTPWPQPYGDLWAIPVAGGEAVRLMHDKWEDGPSDWAFARLPEKRR